MTLFSRLLVLAAALPVAFATFNHNPSDCKGTEFYWGDKSICIPRGGFPNPPKPPKGKDCPTRWSWNNDNDCCLPQEPPTSTPTCGSGWGWNKGRNCCEQNTPPPTTTSHSPPAPTDKCKGTEFWWGDKEICIPIGGFPNPPKPPSGTDCPSNWNWHDGKKTCIPCRPNPPPPQCGSGWGWDGGCCRPPTSSRPSVPAPSSKPGQVGYPGHGGNGNYRRGHKARNISLCPTGLEACPIAGLMGLTDDWECLDVRTELQSCGGCASTGAGQDCTAIPGAWNVGCNDGKCVVLSCADGYLRSADNKSCVKV